MRYLLITPWYVDKIICSDGGIIPIQQKDVPMQEQLQMGLITQEQYSNYLNEMYDKRTEELLAELAFRITKHPEIADELRQLL